MPRSLVIAAAAALAGHAGAQNLLANDGFETPLNYSGGSTGNWLAFFGGATFQQAEIVDPTSGGVPAVPPAGNRVLQLGTFGDPNTFVGVVQTVPVTEGDEYELSLRARRVVQNTVSVEYRVEWLDAGGGFVGGQFDLNQNITAQLTTAFEPFSLVATAPQGAVAANVVIATQSFAGSSPFEGFFQFDAVEFGSTAVVVPPPAGSVILVDEFDGGALNTSLWFQPTGGGTFLGRTQMRPPPPQAPALEVSNGTLKLVLDTFNPTGVGTFWGSEIRTLEVYELEEGLIFETRSRLLPGTSGGILGSLFMYTTDQQVRDEIDFEILSNDIGFSPTSRVLTNVFVDDDFSQPGASSFRSVPNLDITQFNDYRIEWYPDRIDWYINDALVRRDTVNVPDGVVPGTVFDPTRIHLNTWAPDQFFSVAFNAALQPAASQGQNQRFTYEVDRVEIRRAIGPCNAADIIEPFGTLDALDLSGAVNAVNAGFPEADFDASGTIDIFDLFFYLDLFESGCP